MSIWKKVMRLFGRKVDSKRKTAVIRYWTARKCKKYGHKSSLERTDGIAGGEFKCRRCGRMEYAKAGLHPEEVKRLSPTSLAMARAGLRR